MSGTVQGYIPTEYGFTSLSGTWHYLKRCAGDLNTKKSLEQAAEEGDSLCGVCCSRFAWYSEIEETER